ncbi:zinc finger BED domain-containing protein RICESLEEPER 2-like [Impatiens glandulifera]|uniref:zinc finger BED domain-containing protein RICESLEEPER 2-like n=1 Tax=Impatiens glandulifera TaxID=253017 RepID=UPI001FB0CFC0|nr:zinc finger BED domain-containing protein RICESLEEPER 2-like [Impatiens glandulifera]
MVQYADTCGVTVSMRWRDDVTHVIASTDANGGCGRTITILKLPKLFNSYTFIFAGDFFPAYKHDLIGFVITRGGITKEIENPFVEPEDDKTIVVYDETSYVINEVIWVFKAMDPVSWEKTMIEINDDECDGALRIKNVNVDGEKDKKEGKDDEVEEEGKNVEDGKDDEVEEDKGNFERKKRKKVSKAHTEFIEVIGNDGHFKYQSYQIQVEMNPLSDGKYDHMKQREAIAHWILMNEQPFNVVESFGFTFMLSINQPLFEKISCATTKKDVINVYDIEKKKLQLALRDINKISLTTDIWKSKVQKISYMCVTSHFVDSNWNLHKRLLSFIPLPPPHAGHDIFNGLMKCTKDWRIEHKVFTISVDNASNNDSAIRIAKETLSKSRKFPLEGKLFHVRCTAHILNLVVQDGLSEIQNIIDDVKKSVQFINQSESRLRKFSDVVHHLRIQVKKLIIDCPTHWNSTYEMLVEAYRVKDAFPIFKECELFYRHCPSPDDWKKVKDVIDILEVFYEATHIISGVDYPTSNVYLAVIWRVKHVLNEKENHVDEFIRMMIKKMKEKFDKYWGECNLLMAIGAILDPRFKMRLVDFSFGNIYSKVEALTNVMRVREALYNLFFEYVEVDQSRSRKSTTLVQCSSTCANSTSKEKFVPSGLSMFDRYLDTVEVHDPLKSDLDIYLEEGFFRTQDEDTSVQFDALAWWKSMKLKFKILSKLARDVLAIPISTVASEATFSAGTRVLDPYRSRLTSDMV